MNKKKIRYQRNYLDVFSSESNEIITLQRKLEKDRINSTISRDTSDKFRKFVKKNHNGVIAGTYSFELEKAILFYLHFFNV